MSLNIYTSLSFCFLVFATLNASGRQNQYCASGVAEQLDSRACAGSASSDQQYSGSIGKNHEEDLQDRPTQSTRNSVQYIENFPGDTADVQLASCLAAVPTGGICDARGYGATTQTLAATITTSAGQTLLLSLATKFQSASPRLDLFHVSANSHVSGLWFDCDNQRSYSGNVFIINSNVTNGDNTSIADIRITCGGVSTGTGLLVSAVGPSGAGIGFLTIRHWRQIGLLNGMLLTATNNGWVNGNHFVDMEWSYSVHGMHFTNNGGQLNANICDPCSFQYGSSGEGILFDGTSKTNDYASQNVWIGDMWDTPTPVSFLNAKADSNLIIGHLEGTIRDPNDLNCWINLHTNEIHLRAGTRLTAGGGGSSAYTRSEVIMPEGPSSLAGFGASPVFVARNSSSVFIVRVGTGGRADSGTVTMPPAVTGWACQVSDMTHDVSSRETAYTKTSVTVAATRAWKTGDNLLFNCASF